MAMIDRRIAAQISWSRTGDRKARTQPARDKFLERFEHEVDPDGTFPPDERRQRAEHAKKAHLLRLAKLSGPRPPPYLTPAPQLRKHDVPGPWTGDIAVFHGLGRLCRP